MIAEALLQIEKQFKVLEEEKGKYNSQIEKMEAQI